MKRNILIVLLLIIFSASGFAAGEAVDDVLDGLYAGAEAAIGNKDFKTADILIARYLGMAFVDGKTRKGYSDILPLLNKMGDRLKPTAFISGRFEKSFLSFFFDGAAVMWAVTENNITDKNIFLSRSEIDETGKYVCQFRMTPFLEAWKIMDGAKMPNIVAPLGDGGAGPEIVAGIVVDKDTINYLKPVKLDDGLNIQYVWHFNFIDLDGDKVPEIWIRYNAAGGSGFTQRLDIYKIHGGKTLKLLKRFEGEAEGIARRLKDGTVQTGYGYSETTGHMGFDMTMLETWEYDGKDFKKTGEKPVPHILRNEDWTKYYFE